MPSSYAYPDCTTGLRDQVKFPRYKWHVEVKFPTSSSQAILTNILYAVCLW